MHDTFFISAPASTLRVPEDYLSRVRSVHEDGGYGSCGYGSEWKRSEAMKNILRTHTTAVSARMLYESAKQPGGFKPIKCFSIDRVFRNESLDATHLAEFHQVEGLVADYGLSLGDLIGTITEFFRRIGITDLRFKPAFNPYTEPSMEIFGYHPDLKRTVEIGNCIPAEDQILTANGFLNYTEMSTLLAAHGTVKVACYDAATRMITYEAIDSSRIIAKDGQHDMVQLAPGVARGKAEDCGAASNDALGGDAAVDRCNNVSLVVTGNHELYLRFGRQESSGRYYWPKSDGITIAPYKVPAARLLEHKEMDAVQVIALAAEGMTVAGDLPFTAPLKLAMEDHVHAFLELYGYWLRGGSLNLSKHTITFQPSKEQDLSYLDDLLARLPLERVEKYADVKRGWWKGTNQDNDGSWLYAIGDTAWWRFFVEEYGCMSCVTDAYDEDGVVHTKSAKWLFDWALTSLGKRHARRLIVGLRIADGNQSTHDKYRIDEPAQDGQIWTSSARFRDEICQLLIHAGYSARFTVDTESDVTSGAKVHGSNSMAVALAWTVHYSDQPCAAAPSLTLNTSVAPASYTGTVWCVNVPHKDHLIITRRVTEMAPNGSVRAVSRPVIIGNSGIFRPEMLEPMGLPAGVRVIAWGLSLERPTMIKYRLKNIRDLFGHKVKLEWSASAPIARF